MKDSSSPSGLPTPEGFIETAHITLAFLEHTDGVQLAVLHEYTGDLPLIIYALEKMKTVLLSGGKLVRGS